MLGEHRSQNLAGYMGRGWREFKGGATNNHNAVSARLNMRAVTSTIGITRS